MNSDKNFSIDQLLDAAGPLVTETMGPKDVAINHFSSAKSATKSSMGFVNSPKYLADTEASDLVCVVAPVKLKETIEKLNSNKTWLFSPNPDLAAQVIKKKLFLQTPYRAPIEGVHASAVIDETAEVGLGVTIGPHAVIGKNVKIGEGTFIGANAVIEENADIKSHVTIHPLAYIGHSCVIGHHCEVMPNAVVGSEGFGYSHDHLGNHYRNPHSGRVILEDDVHIGGASAIDRGTLEDTVIGKGTKIDNHVHLAHNTIVGKNGLITAHVVVAGSTTIGDNFVVGGNSAITGHINITDNVQLAGFTGVANNITESGQYGGFPILPLKESLKSMAASKHLPEIKKQMNRVLRKLFPEDYK